MRFHLWTCILCLFFFFKQKTAYEMRISDWSSDVCSSDLASSAESGYFLEEVRRQLIEEFGETAEESPNSVYAGGLWVRTSLDPVLQKAGRDALRDGLLRYHGNRGWTGPIATIEIGRAACRERVWR